MHSSRRSIEIFIPLILIALFLSVTLPGIAWGAPNIWHPDELVRQVGQALYGNYEFDEKNFDYPSLPKYTMYGLGKIIFALDYSFTEFLIAARTLSAVLGALVVAITYVIARLSGAGLWTGVLAAALVLTSSEMTDNARFAHNDMYVSFFVILSVLGMLRYRLSGNRLWLYAAFFAVGLTASSKYNGASLLLAVLVVYILDWKVLKSAGVLRNLETLAIGGILVVLGYGLGTPKSLLWMAFYLKRAIPAIQHHAIYGIQPDSLIGLFGQWALWVRLLGVPVALLFLAAFVWQLVRLVQFYTGKLAGERGQMELRLVLLVSILALDLPIMISYNYQSRFFLPMIPLLAILSALFVSDLVIVFARSRNLWMPRVIVGVVVAILVVTFPRVISVALLFKNDARIAASRFVQSLPAGTSIEYTLYPPSLPEDHFKSTLLYPIFFKKYPEQVEPTSRFYQYNTGQAGLDQRQTDYFVVDSFTYGRFEDPFICASNQVECDFFERLLAGETNYKLMADFAYHLPWYLPQLKFAFLNPEIRVYARQP